MPSALPGISAGKVAELLQQTDRLIKTVPEVQTVFGKAGRAESATDPAPLEMFETTIQFKPRSQWRAGMTTDKLIEELDQRVKVPGLSNIWVPPIRNRIDMLATGIKSPVGVKVAGTSLQEIDRIAELAHTKQSLYEQLTNSRKLEQKIEQLQAMQQSAGDIERQLASKIAEVELLAEQLKAANALIEPAHARTRELEIQLAQANAKATAHEQIGEQLRAYLDKIATTASAADSKS